MQKQIRMVNAWYMINSAPDTRFNHIKSIAMPYNGYRLYMIGSESTLRKDKYLAGREHEPFLP